MDRNLKPPTGQQTNSRKKILKVVVATAGLIAVIAVFVGNVDQIISTLSRWFPYTTTNDMDEGLLPPFDGGVIELTLPVKETSNATIRLEAVHAPKKALNLYHMYYDVFLRNDSPEDVLLVAVEYTSLTFPPPWGDGADTGTVLPAIMYELEYNFGEFEPDRIPLSPPFELKKHSLRAIRFHFRPTSPNKYHEEYAGAHMFKFWLIDSDNRRYPIVGD